MVNINLPPDILALAPDIQETDPRLAKHQRYLDRLGDAISADRGIKLTYATKAAAEGERLKFYRARRYVQNQGIKSFDKLTLTVSAPSDGTGILTILKDLEPTVEAI